MTSVHLHPIFGEYLWIQAPCFKVGQGWKPMVFVDDLKLYEKLQEKIFDSYKLEKYKQPQEESTLSTIEKQDDTVPF